MHIFLFGAMRQNLELQLQSSNLSDASVPLLVDHLHLCLQDPPLALCVAQPIGDLLVLVALQEPVMSNCDEQCFYIYTCIWANAMIL